MHLFSRLEQFCPWELLPFFSKKAGTAERKYWAYDQKLLVVYQGIKHFRLMVEARKFITYTDPKSPKYNYALTNCHQLLTMQSLQHSSPLTKSSLCCNRKTQFGGEGLLQAMVWCVQWQRPTLHHSSISTIQDYYVNNSWPHIIFCEKCQSFHSQYEIRTVIHYPVLK